MDDRQFDVLLRRVARQTSRRAALAALLGGALLLRESSESEANDKAKRRKERERQSRFAATRGVQFLVDNTAGTKAITVEPGGLGDSTCCEPRATETIPAGDSRTFETSLRTGYVFINQRFWFQVTNPDVGKPYLAAALGGIFNGHNVACCQGFHSGATVEYRRTFSEGQSRNYDIQGPVFTVTRNRDKARHKHITVKLPASI